MGVFLSNWAGLAFLLQTPDSGGGLGSGLFMLLLLVAMLVFYYFFLIRPQRKRQQELQALIESLKRGDEVITAGGIHGKIKKVEKDHILLEVDEEGRTLKMMKDSVIQKEKAA